MTNLIDHKTYKRFWFLECLRLLWFVTIGLFPYMLIYSFFNPFIKGIAKDALLTMLLIIIYVKIIFFGMGISEAIDNYATNNTISNTVNKKLVFLTRISIYLSLCGLLATSASLIYFLVNDFRKHDFSNQKTLWLIGGGIVFCLFLFLSFRWRKQAIEKTIEEQKPHKQITNSHLDTKIIKNTSLNKQKLQEP
jgi:hypothetical protein